MNYLEQSGITANKEEFHFQNYILKQVLINGTEVSCDRLYFNPYDNPVLSDEGEIYYQTSGQHKKIVIQKTSVPLATLEEAINDENIDAVVITSDEDFQKIHGQETLQVDIEGNTQEKTSYNVIAKISSSKSDAKDIIISAHMDSIFGVGADDNASGVGALLELAKYYNSMKDSLTYNIIFVFYGAEELGLLGANAYVSEHADELTNCILDFNVDVIGGGKNIFIEAAGGVKGEFSDLQSPDTNIRAVTDYEYGWRFKEDNNYCSMVPDWLLKNIKDSCTELNYTFQPGNGIGSDHQVFARYGIPATDITAFGNYVNTAQDTLDKIDSSSMLKAAQIVASVVNKTMLTYAVQ
jgi:Zn-dependent M28 family amino/carboxypeptidase